MDFYAVLGVSSDCDQKEIDRAFRKLAMVSHPDRFEGEAKTKAEKRYQQIVKAYNTLKNTTSRSKYDEQREKQSTASASGPAQVAQEDPLRVGVALLRQGHREKALVYLTRSIQSAPQAEAYWYRAQVYAELPRYRKQAIEDALKAFEMDPYKEKIVVFAAELLLEQGLVSKAKSVLEEGLKRMPEAKKLPELYREHFVRETEKSGVIHSLKNKLFRRKP